MALHIIHVIISSYLYHEPSAINLFFQKIKIKKFIFIKNFSFC